MHRIKKIVVFTGDASYSVRKGIMAIDKALPGLSWLILVHAPTHSFGHVLRNQWRNLRRHGWRRFPDIALSVYRRLSLASSVPVSSNHPRSGFTTGHIESLANFEFIKSKNIHSKEVINKIKDFQPDIGLSLAAPILRKNIFRIPSLGTLNLHKGKVPEYRGMPPAFWEMWNGEASVGCTVHWVDEKLDTGAIAGTSSIDCEKFSTIKGLQLALDELGSKLMRETVLKIDQGVGLSAPQTTGGKTYRKPSLKQEAELKQRINASVPQSNSALKAILKDTIRKAIFICNKSGLYRFVAPRVTVLLYHRVTDSVRDNLTIGIEQFDRQMMLLRRHFQIITLSELVEMDRVPQTSKPIVCITFDDGYLDNYVNAVPILIRNNIHATFFVSSGLIGTSRQFPHDIRRKNQPIPLMEWHHLREMGEAGFAIGSHTINHIDCATEPEELVRSELIQSKRKIQSEVGVVDGVFSYPYGGKEHMTKERLEIVKEMGYSGCVSAYGGTNIGNINKFNILRRGIHWEFSDASFLYSALGLS